MRFAVVLFLLVGCEATRPSVGAGRATATVQEFRRHDQPTRWVVTVNNPTAERVYIDCEEARIPIEAGTQTDVLLTPEDQDCDLKNDIEYASMPSHRRGHSWARRRRERMSP